MVDLFFSFLSSDFPPVLISWDYWLIRWEVASKTWLINLVIVPRTCPVRFAVSVLLEQPGSASGSTGYQLMVIWQKEIHQECDPCSLCCKRMDNVAWERWMAVPGVDNRTTSTEAERKEHDPFGGCALWPGFLLGDSLAEWPGMI